MKKRKINKIAESFQAAWRDYLETPGEDLQGARGDPRKDTELLKEGE